MRNHPITARKLDMARVTAGPNVLQDNAITPAMVSQVNTIEFKAAVRQLRDSFCRYGDDFFRVGDAFSDNDFYCRQHTIPDGWRESGVPWHPAYWNRNATRVDQFGNKWRSQDGGTFIADDFGSLVEVATA